MLRRDEDRPFAHRWLPHLLAGGVGLQVCPTYAADDPGRARAVVLAQIAQLTRALEENPDGVFRVAELADLDRLDGSRLGLMLAMEGVEALHGDPAAFEEFHALGVRMVGLTWNHPNEFAGGIETPGQGVSRRGRELLERMRSHGVVLDLAHASEATWADALDVWDAPLVVSHAGCRAVHDHVRNLSDDQLRSLASRDGVLGMMALALVVDPGAPTLDRWLDHVDHAVAVMGVEHVCLGADFIDQVARAEIEAGTTWEGMMADAQQAGGGRFGLEGFTGPEHYGAAVDALRRRGYDGDRLDAILRRNLVRVLRNGLAAA